MKGLYLDLKGQLKWSKIQACGLRSIMCRVIQKEVQLYLYVVRILLSFMTLQTIYFIRYLTCCENTNCSIQYHRKTFHFNRPLTLTKRVDHASKIKGIRINYDPTLFMQRTH